MRDRLLRSVRGVKRRLSSFARQHGLNEPGARFADKSESPITRCLDWLRRNELDSGGIRVHHRHHAAYPEVTGYLIPTLLDYGESDLAHRCLRWILAVQRANGGFPSPEGVLHIFDTGQVLRGLLAGMQIDASAGSAAKRTMRYLCDEMKAGGEKGFGARYSDGSVPESVHLYVLPPLLKAAQSFGDRQCEESVHRCAEFYVRHPSALKMEALTHFLAYELEALIDLGRVDDATATLLKLKQQQRPDGSVAAKEGAEWVCTPGLTQLAICWYKTGEFEAADRALEWLERNQTFSGGFRGSYGRGAEYFPREELSWAAKFYLDAHKLRVKNFIERHVDTFPSDVDLTDGRLLSVANLVRPEDMVLEVGCGKGRFLRALHKLHPKLDLTGVDISRLMLSAISPPIKTVEGALENVPFDDVLFDLVFSIEAIEHSGNIPRAVAEMARVTKPGGKIVIVDKEKRHWGRFKCPPWERWPANERMKRLLGTHCDSVQATPVTYDGNKADGLMVAWSGRKRAPLSGSAWNKTLIGADSREKIIKDVLEGRVTPWAQEIFNHTEPGQTVFEIGSGTGQISLQLAQSGRKVTINDISSESLEFTQQCARDLKIDLEVLQADATQPLPLKDDSFDCTWNAGLLEHFGQDQRRAMLREWARVTAGKLIILVPNASSIAYRVGKRIQEADDKWPYGFEGPLVTLRDDFAATGLTVTEEYSVGAKHSLNFLPQRHPLRAALARIMKDDSRDLLDRSNQGYLLVTVGVKNPNR